MMQKEKSVRQDSLPQLIWTQVTGKQNMKRNPNGFVNPKSKEEVEDYAHGMILGQILGKIFYNRMDPESETQVKIQYYNNEDYELF